MLGRLAAGLAAMAWIAPMLGARAADLEFFTGEALVAQCSQTSGAADAALRQARCEGYVLGVSDAQQAAQGAGRPERVCLPPEARTGELADTVRQFLASHPEKRRLAAQDLVLEALAARFPCR